MKRKWRRQGGEWQSCKLEKHKNQRLQTSAQKVVALSQSLCLCLAHPGSFPTGKAASVLVAGESWDRAQTLGVRCWACEFRLPEAHTFARSSLALPVGIGGSWDYSDPAHPGFSLWMERPSAGSPQYPTTCKTVLPHPPGFLPEDPASAKLHPLFFKLRYSWFTTLC